MQDRASRETDAGMPGKQPRSPLPRRFKRIHVELTNHCNFSCTFCPDAVMTRPRGFMDQGLATSTLDQIHELELADKVTFHVMGEPLLHPHVLDIIDHAAMLGLPVGLTTNGGLLTGTMIQSLAERDLRQIDISLQSPDAESFASTRGTSMDFERYTGRLLQLLAACWVRPSRPIFKLRIMTTRFGRKLRDQLNIPDFLGTSEELRQTIVQWARSVYDRLGLDPHALARVERRAGSVGIYGWNVIEIAPRIFLETYVLTDWGNAFNQSEIREAPFGYCFGMRDHFAVLHNGDVTLCCIDYEGRTAMGNLNEQRLATILASPEMERIVNGFRWGRLVHPYCRACLGSDSRLGALIKPPLSFVGLKLLKPLFYRHYRLYE